ncbi:hypothetical protein ACFWQC_18750 [Nocardioides sp. NPDC058538]|uniref:hypothetical protein n=1 Tax=Nocardioides sp. NPDC058538 TaxID=3346542 RepID=UPI00364B9B40
MRRHPRRVLVSLWALAGVMTLLSLLFAAPASADTVTPVRHCMHGDDYRELDGDSSSVATAPEGYLIVSYCVDSRGRWGGSEVRTLSTPQRTTVVWHSDGRPIEGYSVEYTRVPSSDGPEEDDDPEAEEEAEGGQGEDDEAGQTAEAEAEQSAAAEDDEAAAAGAAKKPEKERAPSVSATEKEQKPSRKPSVEISALPEDSSQMTALSDGEELQITSVKEFEDEDEENLRSLVVAGGIIIVGLVAGAIALLVRLPGSDRRR